MGNLIWGSGGAHPIRRLNRQLSMHCSALVPGNPSANGGTPATAKEGYVQYWDYNSLMPLLVQGKIEPKQMEAVARGVLVEIFFDLYQQWSRLGDRANLHMKFNYAHPDATGSKPIPISVNVVWSQANQDWQSWQQAGLEEYSPNHAPLIWDAKGLQQQVQSNTYQTLAAIIDGHQPLRNLAIQWRKNLLAVTKALIPHVEQGLIKLLEIEDFKVLLPPRQPSSPQLSSAAPSAGLPTNSARSHPPGPLIAYIDDHKEDGQTMSRILGQMGYRCIYIEDAMQALPLLLDQKPNLIFLDLVMPVINGYEACAQIRRISRFKDTPIIILTSADGIVDRVRAKIVGSTGFLAKPIKPDKVQAVVQKYLGTEKLV